MYNVDGFLFPDEETAKLARKEEEGIRFIKERTALDNPEVVLRLYKKLLEQELFVTPVGVRFLVELQNILLASVYISRDEIPPIPAQPAVTKKEESTPLVEPKTKPVVAEKDYKRPYHVALFFAIVFGVSVLGMFAINAISGNHVNILNYREAILDEYSSWEAELRQEEERLQLWEETLEQREAQD